MLVPLVCTQCGGKLEVETSQVFESGDIFIVASDQTFKCIHCETKYVSGEKIKRFVEPLIISINGGMNGGNIIIGSGNIFSTHISKSPITDNEEEKISNK
jgi:hypothetical protein